MATPIRPFIQQIVTDAQNERVFEPRLDPATRLRVLVSGLIFPLAPLMMSHLCYKSAHSAWTAHKHIEQLKGGGFDWPPPERADDEMSRLEGHVHATLHAWRRGKIVVAVAQAVMALVTTGIIIGICLRYSSLPTTEAFLNSYGLGLAGLGGVAALVIGAGKRRTILNNNHMRELFTYLLQDHN